MTRYYFSEQSAQDLKSSLTNSIPIANIVFWEQFSTPFVMLQSSYSSEALETFLGGSIELKPFKPSPSKLYNRVVSVLGYRDWG